MKVTTLRISRPLRWGLIVLLSLCLVGIVRVTVKRHSLRYVSVAKLVAGGRMGHWPADTNDSYDALDFYQTIISTLESPGMHERAHKRALAQHPEAKQAAVEVGVTQNKGSAIFVVAAHGAEPRYTQVFLDALLDEFREFRDQRREEQRNKALTALAERVVKAEANLKTAMEALAAFKRNNDVAKLQQSQKQTIALLKDLQANKARADTQLEATQQGARTDRALIDARVAELMEESREVTRKLAEHDRLQKALEESKRAHEAMFAEVHKFQT